MKSFVILSTFLLYVTIIAAQNIGGRIDSTFGNFGIAQTGTPNYVTTSTAIFHPNGSIVVAGDQMYPYPQIYNMRRFGIANFSPNGGSLGLSECGGLFMTTAPKSLYFIDSSRILLAGEVSSDRLVGPSSHTSDNYVYLTLFEQGVNCQAISIKNSDPNIHTYGGCVEVLGNGKFIIGTVQTNVVTWHFFNGLSEEKVVTKSYPNQSVYPIASYSLADSSFFTCVKINPNSVVINKFLADGSLDTNFGTNGNLYFSNFNCLTAKKIADNRFVLYAQNRLIFLNPDMSLNKTVNLSLITTSSQTHKDISPNAFAITANEKILTVCGNHYQIACYNSDGSPDNTFGINGLSDTIYSSMSISGNKTTSLLIEPSGNVIGYGWNEGYWTLARYIVSEPAPVLSGTMVAPSACGQTNGSISLNTTYGESPFTYSWNTGDTSSTLSSIGPGFYSVVVTDARGLKDTLTITLGGDTGGMSVTSTTQPASCGNANGIAQVMVLGGTAPYTYSWQNGTNSNQLNGVGSYEGLVWDAAGCAAFVSVTIPAFPVLHTTNIVTPLLCENNISNGAINLTVTAGVQPYTYTWSNGATTEDIIGLSAGDYEVTITDSVGCTLTETYHIVNDFLSLVTTVFPDACGNCEGEIEFLAKGGISPYVINFNSLNFNIGESPIRKQNICTGVYDIEITDHVGCKALYPIDVLQLFNTKAELISVDEANCLHAGKICLNIEGNHNPYHLHGDNQSGGLDFYIESVGNGIVCIDEITQGDYSIRVFSSHCSTVSLDVTVPYRYTYIYISGQNATNGQGGRAYISQVEGKAPFTYSWSNGATTDTINNLVPGVYTCTFTDANGCTDIQSITVGNDISIVEPEPIVEKIEIAPNPHQSSFQIKVTWHENEFFHYTLLNTLGQEVWKQFQEVHKGENAFNVYTENLPKGIYVLKVSDNIEQKATFRVIKD